MFPKYHTEVQRLWYDQVSGSLYWCDSHSLEKTHGPLVLEEATSFGTGKSTPALQSEAAASFNDSSCFSLASVEKTLHVAAASEEVANEWIAGLTPLLPSGVASELSPSAGTRSLAGSRRASVLHQRSRSVFKGFVASEGTVVTLVLTDENGPYTEVKRLWHNQDDNSLYWCDSHAHEKEHGPFALTDATFYATGKTTQHLLSSAAALLENECCFSLETDGETSLNVCAANAGVAAAWTAALVRLGVRQVTGGAVASLTVNVALAGGKAAAPVEPEQDLPEGWKEYADDNGRAYFYNSSTKENVWERPTVAPAVAPLPSPDDEDDAEKPNLHKRKTSKWIEYENEHGEWVRMYSSPKSPPLLKKCGVKKGLVQQMRVSEHKDSHEHSPLRCFLSPPPLLIPCPRAHPKRSQESVERSTRVSRASSTASGSSGACAG